MVANADATPAPGDPRTELAQEIRSEVLELFLGTRRETSDYAAMLHPELTSVSIGILRRVARRENVTSARLAVELCMDKGSVSRQLTLLRKIGFVEALPDPKDGRALSLNITPLAQERWEQLKVLMGEEYGHRFEGWSDEELQTFLAYLHRYNAALAATNH